MSTLELRRIKCLHPKFLSSNIEVDYSDLFDGASAIKPGTGKRIWGGPFTGRPKLAAEILETIHPVLSKARPQKLHATLSALRTFFRFLDSFEFSAGHFAETYLPRVDEVEQIKEIHGVRWLLPAADCGRNPASPETYARVSLLIQQTRYRLRLPRLYWPPPPPSDPVNRRDTPNIGSGIRLIRILTTRVHDIWKRWDRCDDLAQSGRNLIPYRQACGPKARLPFRANEADAHATYRALIQLTGNPIPSVQELNAAVGKSRNDGAFPRWWPRRDSSSTRSPILFDELQAGLYPTTSDLYCLASLFLARTGWNPTTLYALDCRTDETWSARYGERFVWIHSHKARGNSWQETLSPENHSTHCFQIIKRLLARTKSLRELVIRDPERTNYPDIAAYSPWLGVSNSYKARRKVHVLEEHLTIHINRFLAEIVEGSNQGLPPDSLLLPRFRPSDLRDVYAEAVHRDGNYSLLLTQLALGHRHMRTTRHYIRSRAWRKESEQRLHDLTTALFDQIEVHKVIDATTLRAVMDGVEISKDGLARLENYRRHRTYSGLICRDPTNPPEWIDPGHPRDGVANCAQGHRCPACPKGLVLNDSLNFLARYVAELRVKRELCGDAKWLTSTDSEDLAVYEATLRQWPKEEVDSLIERWRREIETGHHNILITTAGVHEC